jgi:hypothetical protein
MFQVLTKKIENIYQDKQQNEKNENVIYDVNTRVGVIMIKIAYNAVDN